MDLLNGAARFGAVSKFFHWAVFLLFVNQYATGILMMRLERGHLVLGFAQGDYYTWHKSVGLLVLALVLLRITWRKTTRLPDWPATLAPWEQGCMKWTERDVRRQRRGVFALAMSVASLFGSFGLVMALLSLTGRA